MKRKIVTALLLGAALALTGCGSTEKKTETTAETAAETESSSAAETAAESETETGTAAESEESETESEEPETEPAYSALDYVTLGAYKGLTVTLEKVEVSDEEVEEQVAANLKDSDQTQTLTEGAVEDGDTVVIDFVGKLDGEAFDGGTSQNYELEIGSGKFIDGFEDGLIGVEVGETVDLNLTFPESYTNAELAGQDVVFTVTVNEIHRAPDELTDEIVQVISDYETVEEYRNFVKESLLEQKANNQPSQKLQDLYAQIYDNSTIIDYPEDVVAYRSAQYIKYYKSMAEAYSMEYADFLSGYFGMDEENFATQITAVVESSMTQELLMNAIADTEGLEVDDAYYDAHVAEYVEKAGVADVAELESTYTRETIMENMRMDMAMDLVVENCIVTNPEDAVETEAVTQAETETDAETDAESESGTDTTETAATETESTSETDETSESESTSETETSTEK